MQPAQKDLDGVYRHTWDSLGAMVEDAFSDDAQSLHNAEDIRERIQNNTNSKWANHKTPDDLRTMLVSPDKKLLRAIDAMRSTLADDLALPTVPRRRVRHGREDGEEMDADRWLVREPNCWDRTVRESVPRRTVIIGINLSVHCQQKPAELLYRGAAACALADVLTLRGMNVGIVGFLVVNGMSSGCPELVSKVEIKAPDMPLDMAALSTAACEIGFFRMVMVYATARRAIGKLDGSLGGPSHLPECDRAGLTYVIEQSVCSHDAAVDWLREAVSE
jgi:hypothetical protein